jgi:hypothetical protein
MILSRFRVVTPFVARATYRGAHSALTKGFTAGEVITVLADGWHQIADQFLAIEADLESLVGRRGGRKRACRAQNRRRGLG